MTGDDIMGLARQREGGFWEMGDYLVRVAGPPTRQDRRNGALKILEEVAAALAADGFDEEWPLQRLQKLRKVAHAFPPAERRDVGIDAHIAAGSPEWLRIGLANWDRSGSLPRRIKYLKWSARVNARVEERGRQILEERGEVD